MPRRKRGGGGRPARRAGHRRRDEDPSQSQLARLQNYAREHRRRPRLAKRGDWWLPRG